MRCIVEFRKFRADCIVEWVESPFRAEGRFDVLKSPGRLTSASFYRYMCGAQAANYRSVSSVWGAVPSGSLLGPSGKTISHCANFDDYAMRTNHIC